MSGDQTRLNELRKQVLGWNKVHPVGTKVRTPLYPGRVLETSSAATVLFGRKPVVHLAGFSGYFDLETVTPVETAGHEEQRTVIMFPGQGTQRRGMGAELFTSFPDETRRASEILGYSIEQLCVDDPQGRLDQTRYAQVALYVVNALGYMQHQRQSGQPRCKADILMGHSLGEYNALQAAGVFDFATGLRMVQRRGALMGQVTGGGMAAVIGLTPDRIETLLAGSEEGRRIDVANFNSSDQTVIAGPEPDLAAVQPAFEAAGARKFSLLKVSAPFHSRYMREPMLEFGHFLEDFGFAAPSIPVIANVSAQPYPVDAVRDTLARQIGHSVRWLDTMTYLFDHGVTDVEEVGPGTVLAKLAQRIKKARSTEVLHRP